MPINNGPQPDFITGLELGIENSTTFSIGTGAAFIPSLNRVIVHDNSRVITDTELTASTTYYVYLYWASASAALVEHSTTAPAVNPYFGEAKIKQGDTSRRYIGSFTTGETSVIIEISGLSTPIAKGGTGASNASKARENLGLAKQENAQDDTSGAIMVNGAWGLGGVPQEVTDAASLLTGSKTRFFTSPSSGGTNFPPQGNVSSAGYWRCLNISLSNNLASQLAFNHPAAGVESQQRMFYRNRSNGLNMAWREVLNCEDPQNISGSKIFATNPQIYRTYPGFELQTTLVAEGTVGRWCQTNLVGGNFCFYYRAGSNGAAITTGEQVVRVPNTSGMLMKTNTVAANQVLEVWRGTQEQYNAITTPAATTLYIING